MEQRTLRVMGKGRKERLVPFHAAAAKSLETYLAHRGAFLARKGVPPHERLVRQPAGEGG